MIQPADILAILPLIVVAGASVLVMIAVAIRRSHLASMLLSLAGLAAAFGCLWGAAGAAPRRVTPLLIVDFYAIFYSGLVLVSAGAVVVLCYGYFKRQEGDHDEVYILLLIATLGAMVLAASSHFASFFLGLELLSVPLYAAIAYLRNREISVEAGMKYLVLAAASAAFLLFGMALVYGELGSMDFAQMAGALTGRAGLNYAVLAPALVLIVTGVGFKLAVAPFHMWTPDVYEGAPAPVAAFVATVSKGGMFAVLLRYFYTSGASRFGPVVLIVGIIAVASMLAGNLLALQQNNVKRILAYSSIAHLGYALVAFLTGGVMGPTAATFYLVAYFVTILTAFGVVTLLSGGDRDAADIEDYRGLFWRRPWLAGVFSAALFSLAGIPLTAGFLGKFYVVAAGASASAWGLLLVLVVASAIGLYYYLRVMVMLYSTGEPRRVEASAPAGGLVLAALAVALIWLGVYPGPLVALIRAAMGGVV